MKPLRRAAVAALALGVSAALGFTLYAGRRNPSFVLVTMFVCWVLSPFAGLLLLRPRSNRLMLAVGIGSLAAYSWAGLRPPRSAAAGPFLMIPAATWIALAITRWTTRSKP